MTFTLDWKSIRVLNRSQADGFQALCVQLAEAETPIRKDFNPKGSPDAGVECLTIFEDDSEWGWQSKFFDTLGSAQWSQIDESVKTALEKHPRLVKYLVCVPLNRSDPRIKGRKSAQEKWDDHVRKWKNWAAQLNMDVKFVWWGEHELLERLSQTKHIGRVFFWFGKRGFDLEWFDQRLREAIKVAGPRYTPEVHVTLPIAGQFEAFGRTEIFFNAIKARIKDIRSEIRRLKYIAEKPLNELVDSQISTFWDQANALLPYFSLIAPVPTGPLHFTELLCALEAAIQSCSLLQSELFNREMEYSHEKETRERGFHYANPYSERRYSIMSFLAILEDVREQIRYSVSLAEANVLIVTGRAGTGKTHLLCDLTTNRLKAGMPTLILLGQWFQGQTTLGRKWPT
ncbi:MAG: hypothetical protein SGI88_13625 [Candidatus Hydrogenedentes bacterium]|nr:hypothetical protein [Candidatus Hydrogenedentota bacterium]